MSFAGLKIDSRYPAAYRGVGGGGGSSTGDGASVVFEYVAADAGDDGSGPSVVTIASHAQDSAISWSDPDGVQAVARAILVHFTGDEPDQALLEALTMEKGDTWASSAEWELTVGELKAVVDHQ